VLMAYSTSGQSKNILNAAEAAVQHGMSVIGLSGRTGGELMGLCDVCLCVPSDHTPRIQEIHLLIGHAICRLVEG
jgi:D-sedoheptulose 7-phosphate isomerase